MYCHSILFLALAFLALCTVCHAQLGDYYGFRGFAMVNYAERLTTFGGLYFPGEKDKGYFIDRSFSLDLNEVTNPAKAKWQEDIVARESYPKFHSTQGVAVTTVDGPKVFIFGGQCPDSDVAGTGLTVYNWESKKWYLPVVQLERRWGSSVVWARAINRIIVFGGYLVDKNCKEVGEVATDIIFYNPDADTYTSPGTHGDIPSPRVSHRADMLDDKHMVVIGGITGKGDMKIPGDVAYVLDIDTLEWKSFSISDFNMTNIFSFGLVVYGSSIVLAGGVSGWTNGGDKEILAIGLVEIDTSGSTWKAINHTQMGIGRVSDPGVAVINNYLFYAFGNPYDKPLEEPLRIINMDNWSNVTNFSLSSLGDIPDLSIPATREIDEDAPFEETSPSSSSSSSSLSTGAIVGIVIGGVVLLAVIILLILWKLGYLPGRLRRGSSDNDRPFSLDYENTVMGSNAGFSKVQSNSGTRDDIVNNGLQNYDVQTVIVPRSPLQVVN
ncbi:hypothetical protein IWQ62_001299 [Dispira parvispora]|uniref:Kelch repeat protein n=1 Tax=Dispira parvispora TaxID=1520584 RepID=A0A9W8AWF8_9FUNG|nr:hypothetical protein IWQ62_001299 [Dispira parvispora]